MGGRRLQCLCGWHLSVFALALPPYVPDSVRLWVQVTTPSLLQHKGQLHICQLSQMNTHDPVSGSLCLQHLEAVLFACSIGMYFPWTSLTQVGRLLSNSSSVSNTGAPSLVPSTLYVAQLFPLLTTLPWHSAPSLCSPGISEI